MCEATEMLMRDSQGVFDRVVSGYDKEMSPAGTGSDTGTEAEDVQGDTTAVILDPNAEDKKFGVGWKQLDRFIRDVYGLADDGTPASTII